MTQEAGPIQPLHNPMLPLTVLYDAHCAFCRWTVANLRRWDVADALRFRPYQDAATHPILGELLRERDLGAELHVVDVAGRYAAGGEAVLAIIAALPNGIPVARLVGFWRPASLALNLGYRALSRWRGTLADLFGLNGPLTRQGDAFDAEAIEIEPATVGLDRW